jgi:hypothetical protein
MDVLPLPAPSGVEEDPSVPPLDEPDVDTASGSISILCRL